MKKIAELLTGEMTPLSPMPAIRLNGKNRVQIVALGDVGMSVLLGLKLLGGEQISDIGIFDISRENTMRLEMELSQVRYPDDEKPMPRVHQVEEAGLFDCDVFLFCASKGVPPVGAQGDVRMAQLAANRGIIRHYAGLAKEKAYAGLVCVISDPVDPLCKAFLDESDLLPAQVQGYGLGVMNARARYYAERDERFSSYLTEGRAFGPHGQDLVIANSMEQYDDAVSKELTKLTVNANRVIRDLGYKPYLAPGMSSAAISVLLTLSGAWHYSSLYLGDEAGGAFLGIRNRMTEEGPVYENLPLPEELYARIQTAYDNLRNLAKESDRKKC